MPTLARGRLRARYQCGAGFPDHFPETKNCISTNDALERRLTIDSSELLDPRSRQGRPEIFTRPALFLGRPDHPIRNEALDAFGRACA